MPYFSLNSTQNVLNRAFFEVVPYYEHIHASLWLVNENARNS